MLIAIGAAIAAGGAAMAWAVPVTIPANSSNELNLESRGDGHFDVSQPPDQYNDNCALGDLGGAPADDVGYSPANDARSEGGDTDTFDGGLVLAVARRGGTPKVFEDPNGIGNKVGQQIKVGPANMLGLRVARTERAFAKTPTLRSLIKLRNPKRKALRRKLIWDSDLGADGSEVVIASSTKDLALTNADRWMIFDESDGSDPLGTFVLYGKGKGVKETKVFNPVVDEDSCISFQITLKIPKRSTRYLLFFTQAHDSDAPSKASLAAKKFDRRKPKGVLGGLSKGVKKKIVNWDL